MIYRGIYQYTNLFYPTTQCQVKAKEKELKHKLRPINAFTRQRALTCLQGETSPISHRSV